MADKIIFDGKNFKILNSSGYEYKKTLARAKWAVFGMIIADLTLTGVFGYLAHLAYVFGQEKNGLGAVCGIVDMFLFFVYIPWFIFTADYISDVPIAQANYNLALANNQDAIFKKKEEIAQHQENMKAIQFEKYITFTTPLEKTFTKNG